MGKEILETVQHQYRISLYHAFGYGYHFNAHGLTTPKVFIINLNYIAPLEKLDAHMGDHMKFLRKYYKKNVFIVSGRKVPRTGGIILAFGSSKEEVEKIMHEDPFYIHGLAEFTITEFLTSQYHPDLKDFLLRK